MTWRRIGAPQLLKPALKRCGPHRIVIVGMNDQRLRPALADPLSKTGFVHQSLCNEKILTIGDMPGPRLTAPDMNHRIEVEPDSKDSVEQIGDVQALHLIRSCRSEPGY